MPQYIRHNVSNHTGEWKGRLGGWLVELQDVHIRLVILKLIFSATQEFVSVDKIIAKWIFKCIIAA